MSDGLRFALRPAKRQDCGELCRLIKEFAPLMNSNADKLSPEALEKDGFNTDPPKFKCIVVEDTEAQGTLCGYVLYYLTYDAWQGQAMYIENLHVSPAFQGNKLGTKLFYVLAEEAYKEGYCRIDFNCFLWNTATKFYEKLGAENLSTTTDLHLFRLHRGGIEALVKTQ